jgi:hypothetical protein
MKVKAVIYLLAREGMGSKRYIINFGISTSIEIDGDGAAECIRRLPTRSMPDGFVSYASTDTEPLKGHYIDELRKDLLGLEIKCVRRTW